MDEKKMESVQAVDRALIVLETIAVNASLSINELHKMLGYNKPALSRIVATLHRSGYLNKNEKTGDYSLSLRTFEIGVNAVRQLDYLSMVKGVLTDLSTDLNVVAQFSIEDNNELLCLESFDQKNTGFSIYTRVGQRSSLYSTSAGKAILSTYSNDDIIEKWDEIDKKTFTANTISDIDALLQDINVTRQRGYALDIEENEYGLFCIGMVLMNYNRQPIGAISLSASSMTKEQEERYSSALSACTQRLSSMLGYIQR